MRLRLVAGQLELSQSAGAFATALGGTSNDGSLHLVKID